MNSNKKAKTYIYNGNSKLIWLDHAHYGDDKYRVSFLRTNIFRIDKTNFHIYSYFKVMDTFLKNYGFKNDIIDGDLTYFIDFPNGIERNIENIKVIIQELFDSFLLNYYLESDHDLISD